jgi:hypothetical protein
MSTRRTYSLDASIAARIDRIAEEQDRAASSGEASRRLGAISGRQMELQS